MADETRAARSLICLRDLESGPVVAFLRVAVGVHTTGSKARPSTKHFLWRGYIPLWTRCSTVTVGSIYFKLEQYSEFAVYVAKQASKPPLSKQLSLGSSQDPAFGTGLAGAGLEKKIRNLSGDHFPGIPLPSGLDLPPESILPHHTHHLQAKLFHPNSSSPNLTSIFLQVIYLRMTLEASWR